MKKKNIILLCLFVIVLTLSINVYASSCSEIIPTGKDSIMDILDRYVYKTIKWATPIALIVLTSFDFGKVVFSGDQKGMDKAKTNFLKRSVAALIIFFAPDIIKLLVSFINDQSIASCLQEGFK